jgi:glycosyltransferase involved in cell wall biosynthesis
MIVSYLQRRAIRKSSVVVADSSQVKKFWEDVLPKYREKFRVIPYGADVCEPTDNEILKKLALVRNEYFLAIARIVPENHIKSILNAFRHYKSNKKLVIVGDTNNRYGREMKQLAGKQVIFTDAIFNKSSLDTLRSNCYLYLHGHSVGGTNPSLLEAMAARCACLCHDNPFNRETTAHAQDYFTDSFDLAIHLNSLEHNAARVELLKEHASKRVQSFTWKNVVDSYISIIKDIEKIRK